MGCVTTSSFSVHINGKAYDNFKPTRGLRQGDSLSPYLFLICAEAFTSLLAREEAKWEEVQVISDVLALYVVASSQCINFEKSSVYFSSNTSRVQRDWIKNTLSAKEVEKFESYLGLPTLIGWSKYQAFSFLKERVWKKIQGWKGKLLSKEGKDVAGISDKWLPRHPTNKIMVPPNDIEEDWLLSELIDWNTFQWDHTLIDMVFSRYDAEAIYRIPLSRRYVPNVMFWLHNKNRREVWVRVWKLHIPTKIKVFVWRACHNILPTFEKLRQRLIIEDDLCPICKRVPETILHALWKCAAAQDVWASCSHRMLQKGLTVQVSVIRLIEDLLHKLTLDMFESFLVLCWLLWHRRNRVVHGGILQEPSTLIGRARS
ncbi:uncharacterized protein LOC112025278 [Quercus suber]|uniref:uncharacterized protein LOC112025278 n=1 Tax=Quercus suber TaxID=58331 RepID=UPI000CE1C3D0|nr:uncharacterized protein LOC112025278 [Quercus suber]